VCRGIPQGKTNVSVLYSAQSVTDPSAPRRLNAPAFAPWRLAGLVPRHRAPVLSAPPVRCFREHDVHDLKKSFVRDRGRCREPAIQLCLANAKPASELLGPSGNLERSEEDLVP
jgi:hypothetical protein